MASRFVQKVWQKDREKYGGRARPAENISLCSALLPFSDIHDIIRHADARNYRLFKNTLRLECRSPCRAVEIRPQVHRKRHYPEPGVPMGDGNQERTTPLTVCRN